MSLEGGCRCGGVRIRAEGAPIATRACWCTDCQAIAAGGPTNNVFFRSEDVTIDGEIRWHDVMPDSGVTLSRAFCPECGTPIAAQSHARRHLITLRIGIFPDREALAPASVIWTDSAPGWACIDPALPQVERQPPPLA